MKYIKLFNTHSLYEIFKQSSDYLLPNVSFCKDLPDEIYIKSKNSVESLIITYDNSIYDGTTKVASNIVVTYNGDTLVNNTDYEIVDNTGGINVGTYSFIVRGKRNFKGDKTCSFYITKAVPTYTAPSAKSLTYNTLALALLNAGSTNEGTIQYSSDGTNWSTTIPTGTNAQNYTTYWKIIGDSNHSDIDSSSINTTISPKVVNSPTITLSQDTYTYDGNAKLPTVTVKDGTVTVSSSEYTVNYSNNTNAGTATVTIADVTGGNYTVSGSKTFTINKASGSVSSAPTANTLTYNNSAQQLIVAGSSSTGTMLYNVDGGEWSSSIPTATNADSYVVGYKAQESANYTESTSGTIDVTISKVTPTVTAPTAKVLTYSKGNAQELVNAGSTNYGTLQYSLDNTNWSTSIPTRTSGGSYTVYYRIVGDSNINDVASVSVSCSILEKSVTTPTITLSQDTYTYNGSAFEPTPTVKDGDDVIDSSEYTVTYSNNTNAGTGTVTISDNVGGDYYIIGSATFTINKATGSVSTAPSSNSLTYNTTAQALVTSGSGTGTMMYKLNDGEWSSNIPEATNAGSYTVYYKAAESSNYNESASDSVSITIAKANIIPSVSMSGWTYGSTASNPSVSGNSGSGSVTYYYKGTSEGDNAYTTTKPSNAGSYNIKAIIAETTNYYGATVTNTFTINKADQAAPTASVIAATYPGTSTASATGGGGIGTLTWTNGNTRTAAGTADTYAYWSGNDNYNASPNSNKVTLSVAKYTPTVTLTATNRQYNGNALYATASVGTPSGGIATKGTIYYGTSEGATTYNATYTGGSVNLSSVSVTNVGSVTVYAYFVPDSTCNDVYNNSGNVSKTFSISKADLSAPTATGATTTYPTTATATASGGGGQGSIEWSNGNTQTSVGSKTTKARWSGNSNYNASPYSNEVTLTMNKASQSAPTATGASVSYGNTATASASGGGGQGSIEWSNGNTLSGNVGSKTTKARWAGNDNYNASDWSNEVTLSITKINPSITAPSAKSGLVYNGSSQTLYNAGSNSTSGSFSYSNGTRTNAGSLTVSWTFTPSDTTNYNTMSGSFDVTIAKANRTISFTSAPTEVEKGATITVSASPSAGSGDGTIIFSSNNTSIATVSGSTITGIVEGTVTITATISQGTNYNSATTNYSLSVVSPTINGYEYVDLGLPSGTLWAKYNVGATSEDDYEYPLYLYGSGSSSGSGQKYEGTEDPLNSSVDTATLVLGTPWHMPTKTLCLELVNNTTRKRLTIVINSSRTAYKTTYTANNGKSIIFIYCRDSSLGFIGSNTYWTCHPNGVKWAIGYLFGLEANQNTPMSVDYNNRTNRFGVRAVVG